jgi:DNA-binding transcriptional LysR family regulator
MFIGIGRLNELADTIRTTAGGTVSLGVIPAFAQDIMPEAVREIYERRPDVRVMVYMRNTPAIVDAVRIQQFDLGIVGRSPPYEGVDVLFQTSVPYVCLVPRAHRLARGKARLDLAELAGKEPFITFGGAYPDEMLDMDHELSARLRKNSRLFAANMPVAAALARETGALAIVDPFSARLAKRIGGVVSRPIRQSLKYHIAVITRARSALPLIGQEMASVLIKRFRASTG